MLISYWNGIVSAYENSFAYFWKLISNPILDGRINGFYMLIVLSLLIWGLELLLPWRKKQRTFRKDFWLDAFYMFFNFYLFNLLLYAALSKISTLALKDVLAPLGYNGGHLVDFGKLPWFDGGTIPWIYNIIIFFLIADFVQWCVHNMLHRVPFFWKFHKVHHSVKEMGFAAHLRYHFMETLVYNTAKYVSLSLLFGFNLQDAFYVYTLALLIGHLNHANLGWDYGPLKYIFNNPKMHIWHHAKHLPHDHPKGMNFGISLSIWDYLFGTAYVPKDGRDIELGFPGVEEFPEGFIDQVVKPFKEKS